MLKKIKIFKIILFSFIVLFLNNFSFSINQNTKHTINGHIKDKSNGELLIGAIVYVKELKTGTTANVYGYYSISLPEGKYTFVYSYIGFNSFTDNIDLTKDLTKDIELETTQTTIKEVVITDKKADEKINSTEMSVEKLDAKTIKLIPALMGEVDVLKTIQLLPGVQASGEGMTGFNVRGGSSDENLILLDEATVYNPSHLMGFFSIFNNDAIKDVTLYKGDIPAEYGGRISSLLDIRMKDGNNKEYEVSGGIGTISSRLTVEGPLEKDKGSFIISARRSYADLLLKLSSDSTLNKNKLYFYDINVKMNYTINNNNRIYFSGYYGRDVIVYNNDFNLNWGNNTETFRWNHLFSKKVFSNLSLIFSNYDYNLSQQASMNGFKWVAGMQDYSFKYDINIFPNPNNNIKFGIISTYHHFDPGYAKGNGNFGNYRMPTSNALESAVFINNEQKINHKLSLNYGIRYSLFQSIGPTTVYNFDSKHNPTDSTVYKTGKIYNTYGGFEPRVSIKYSLDSLSSIKVSYTRTRQYVNLASNGTGSIPLDLWLPASKIIKPRIADQYAIGYFRNLFNNKFEGSFETYYKNIQNELDFRDYAQLLLNKRIEGELRFGRAYSYGIEFMMRKQVGKFQGWVSYTYSRAYRKIPELNDGIVYPSTYDKPNNVSIVFMYQITKRLNVAATWVYSTGAAVTFPTGKYEYGNRILPLYSERDSYRMPDYHRLDLGVTLKGKDKPNKKFFGEWNFSVYNVYDRKNAWMITFEQDPKNPNNTLAYKYYLFPILPSVTYNFHF